MPRRFRSPLLIALVACLGLVAAGCTSSQDAASSSSPSSTSSTASEEPPWGLDAVPLPEDQEDIDAVLRAMPTELDGMIGTVEGNEIGYGAGMGELAGAMETFLRVMTLGGEDYGDGASFIEAIVQNGGIEIEGQDLDPGSPVVYVAGLTPARDVTYASVMWAAPDSRYVLLIQGTSPEQRAGLVAAYEQAATDTLG